MTAISQATRANAQLAPLESSLISDPEDFHGRGFNAKSFSFQHALANHPLFSVNSIRALARRSPKLPGFVHWQNGPVGVDATWTVNTGPRLSLDETLAGIAENNSLVVLKHVEQDPEIGPVLQALLRETWDRMPAEVRGDITLGESLIFVNSPRRKTVYHIDLEASHLLQVSGLKTLYVFDGKGKPLISDKVLEQHCAGNQSSAVYDPSRQHEATRHDMVAGYGAHIPSRAPHWVQNGDDVSVSININFDFRSVHHRMRPVYAMNHKLRKLGFNPVSPGRHPALDDMKIALYDAAKWLRGERGASYPNWTPPRS